MIWHRITRIYRSTRYVLVAMFMLANIILALYTVPILMSGNENDNSDFNAGQELQHASNIRLRRTVEQKSVPVTDSSFDNPMEYHHNYLYLLQPTTGCDADNPFLLIVVCSAFHHFDKRQTIRTTWGSMIRRHQRTLATKLVFMLGAPSIEYQHLQDRVVQEHLDHEDVIQETYVDSYYNLTEKSIGAVKWAVKFCSDVKYFMKTDDDVFVNVPNLISVLVDIATDPNDGSNLRFMLGYVMEDAKPIADRNSKWFAPTTLFRETTYPKYLSGSAYVISGNIVEKLYSAMIERKTFWLEDIFVTGMMSSQLDIPLIHNDKFLYKRPKHLNPCIFKMALAVHELSTHDLKKIWQDLHVMETDCSDYIHKRILT